MRLRVEFSNLSNYNPFILQLVIPFRYVIYCLFFFLALPCLSQTDWELKKDKNGIQVFTAKLADSKFKAIRVNCILNARLSQLAAVILQPEIQPEWVLATREAHTVQNISTSHLYYYAEAVLPWPLSNRDMVIDLQIAQDPISHIMTITANSIDHILPRNPGKERIPFSQAIWKVQSVGPDKIKVDYTVRIDPGGGIPAWMVNMFIARAPFESFKNLLQKVQEKRFQDKKFDFLKDQP